MKMCRVTVQSYKLSQHATFNGTMQDGIKTLAYYAFVAGTADAPDDIDAVVAIDLIPKGEQRANCLKDGSAWLCGEKAFTSSGCTAVQAGTFKK
jgi:hypothetical protein